ncbi:MAG: alpha-1,2-fucosyltransferase [Bacteroidota bacterium]
MRRDKYLIQIDEYHYKPILSSSFLRKYKWYFNGYWQNENYFKTYSQKILHDFTPKDNLFSSTLEKDAADIQQCNAISIHFRRGDYVSNTKTAQHHGVCSIEYYMNAVQYVAKRVESPYFYIFSDDIDWVKSNFSLRYGNRVIEGNNQYNSFTDMYLMSLCKHHIIANSTFSWWGAWLGRNPDKIVITPQRWFADFSRNEEKKSIVPPDWIRL